MEFAQNTDWLETGCNILVFGPSGTGKTHLCAALGRSIVELGKRVKFVTATALVQQLQLAKLQLELQPLLAKLDRYDLLIIDDLGYVKKSDSETSVLFELIAHRYERKSLMISANQPFSQGGMCQQYGNPHQTSISQNLGCSNERAHPTAPSDSLCG
jgi:DNA replication protein DnaC